MLGFAHHAEWSGTSSSSPKANRRCPFARKPRPESGFDQGELREVEDFVPAAIVDKLLIDLPPHRPCSELSISADGFGNGPGVWWAKRLGGLRFGGGGKNSPDESLTLASAGKVQGTPVFSNSAEVRPSAVGAARIRSGRGRVRDFVHKEALEKGPTLDEQANWHANVGEMIETYHEIYAKPH